MHSSGTGSFTRIMSLFLLYCIFHNLLGASLICCVTAVCLYMLHVDPMFRGVYHGSTKHRGLTLLDLCINTADSPLHNGIILPMNFTIVCLMLKLK